jgi:hypothetical protein
MSPNVLSPVSRPAKSRGIRPDEEEPSGDKPFLLALSRAFLMAVNAHDRNGTILYSRAILKIMNRGRDC